MNSGRSRFQDQMGFTLVELLVVMALLSVIGAATTSVVISTLRTEQFQGEMQSVMDDGRISLQRIRKEVRAARLVYDTSCRDASVCTSSPRLHFWVDQNQDASPTADEIVCYHTEAIGVGQFELVRWTQAMAGAPGCTLAVRPPDAQVLARTLVANVDSNGDGNLDMAAPFVDFEPDPTADPTAPPTRNIRVLLDLEVKTGRDNNHLELESIIRLRNVA